MVNFISALFLANFLLTWKSTNALGFSNNKAEIKFTISDLLNQRQIFYQNNNSNTDYNKSTDATRFSRKFGTTYGVTLNYSL